jgi:hypothetical protein
MSFVYKNLTSVVPIGGIATLTGNSGGAVGPTAGNIDIVGSGSVTVTGNPGTSTLTISAASPFTWSVAPFGTQVNAVVNNGYIVTTPLSYTVYLPATFAIGDTVRVFRYGTSPINIAPFPASGTTIYMLSSSTTTGVSSNDDYCAMEIVGVEANTSWGVLSATGNWNFV